MHEKDVKDSEQQLHIHSTTMMQCHASLRFRVQTTDESCRRPPPPLSYAVELIEADTHTQPAPDSDGLLQPASDSSTVCRQCDGRVSVGQGASELAKSFHASLPDRHALECNDAACTCRRETYVRQVAALIYNRRKGSFG